MEKQKHFAELVEHILEKYASITLDPQKTREVVLPNILLDMLVPIPQEKLPLLQKSPFFFFEELTLLPIKAFTDNLTRADLIQAMGQLYVIATSEQAKDKTTCLVILSTYFPSALEGEMDCHVLKPTDRPWLFEIQGEYPAYLFITSRVNLNQEGYEIFLPFQTSAQVRKSGKNTLEKWEKEDSPSSAEGLAVVLYWLRKLHPDFYKEVMDKMGISKEEIIKTIGGDILEKTREEGIEKGKLEEAKEAIFRILEARFGEVWERIEERIVKTCSLDKLNCLIDLAATCESLEGFLSGM